MEKGYKEEWAVMQEQLSERSLADSTLKEVASRAFQTASVKMGKECPECGGTGHIEVLVDVGEDYEQCEPCKGSGTVGPDPLALAEACQNGEIAFLVQLADGIREQGTKMSISMETYEECCAILAKIPGS